MTWHDSCPVGLLQVAGERLHIQRILVRLACPEEVVVGLELSLNEIFCVFRALDMVVVIKQQPFVFEHCLSLQLDTSLAEAG